ncbi:MAG: omptin family outer membrane protease [Treponema sp.]|jgi:outer membrane protease|nr:omptin family outer membrane protease [Treponema sp.]
MRNITVLSVLVIISFSVYGQDPVKNYALSMSFQTGFVYGQALELVYQNPNKNDHEFLSELKWDMKPVFYLGMELNYGKTDIMSKPGFFSSVSFKAGFPGDTGIMEDRDWVSSENAELTHYSRHTNKTREFLWLDAAIGLSIPIKSIFYINPFINCSWMRFAFTGRDGYGKYARVISPYNDTYHPIDDNPNIFIYDGQNVITYKQDWFLAALGFTIGTNYFKPLLIDLTFRISPLTYCVAMDEHLSILLLNGTYTAKQTYNDYTSLGLYIEPGCKISFNLRKIDFSLEVNYRYIGNTRGLAYKNNSRFPDLNHEAGAGLSVLDTRFIIKIQF